MSTMTKPKTRTKTRTKPRTQRRAKVEAVRERPDPDALLPYYRFVPMFFKSHLGWRPSRTSLFKYLEWGYPIKRGGPRVPMPVVYRNKRPMVTPEDMQDFMTRVRRLERMGGVR